MVLLDGIGVGKIVVMPRECFFPFFVCVFILFVFFSCTAVGHFCLLELQTIVIVMCMCLACVHDVTF
jgi:hypothetical protein